MTKPRRAASAREAPSSLSPDAATGLIEGALEAVSTELLATSRASGRVLARGVSSDRPSPASDLSAMDGYAFRLDDRSPTLQVSAVAVAGARPIRLERGSAARIFTGAVVPHGADVVVPREFVTEHATSIAVPDSVVLGLGDNIRRTGENGPAGTELAPPGRLIDAAVAATLAGFGVEEVRAYRRVRVAVIVTGDEVRPAGQEVQPWQIRDSNGPMLRTLLGGSAWLEPSPLLAARDDRRDLHDTLARALKCHDVVVLTGGVSVGDLDLVPEVVRMCDCRVVFHGLSIRPGHPLLAAAGPNGQFVAGLPGNPVAALATCTRFVASGLRRRAGLGPQQPPRVNLATPVANAGAVWRYQLVRVLGDGAVHTVSSRGSADIVAVAQSDGIIEVPPNTRGNGPFPFWPWQV
jgi:molybdopterin molybdotransferase